MSQLEQKEREELRAAFERAVGRPRRGAADRVLACIRYDRRWRPGLAWLALPAALLLAAFAVAALLATRQTGTRAVPAASPSTRADIGPVIPPPAFFIQRPAQPKPLRGQRWDGTAAGDLNLPGGTRTKVSPDGSRFLIDDTVYDQAGRAMGSTTSAKDVVWADDSRHLCWLTVPIGGPEPSTGKLMTWQPGEAPHEVASLGRFGGQTGATVRACSPGSDRAVVVQVNVMTVGEVWVVQLSTGEITLHQSYPLRGPIVNVVASHDGSLIAENYTVGIMGAADCVIRDTTTGVTTRMPGTTVAGFSWDGSLAIVTPTTTLQPMQVELREIRSGRTLWSAPAAPASVRSLVALPEPGGNQMLVAFVPSPATAQDVWVVSPDGRARQVGTGVFIVI